MKRKHSFSNEDLLRILQLIAQNDIASYNEFCDVYRTYLGLTVRTKLSRMKVFSVPADDIEQEILIYIWEKRHRLAHVENFDAYVNGAIDKMIATIQRKKLATERRDRYYLFIRGEEGSFSSLEEKESWITIQRAISKLPSRCRYAFVGQVVEGRKLSEIAAEMNISVQSVKNNVNRAKKLLRKSLQKK